MILFMNNIEKNNNLDSFDKNKIRCGCCGKYFELASVHRSFNSRNLREYYKLPIDIKVCSSDCFNIIYIANSPYQK